MSKLRDWLPAGWRYCGRGLPRKPLPAGRYLVHNHVIPEAQLNQSGFRAWTQETRKGLVRCHCDFGGCKNADVNVHYRVQRGSNALERRAYKASTAAMQETLKKARPFKDIAGWDRLRVRASRASAKAYREVMRGA
jgi:hypothetical protein